MKSEKILNLDYTLLLSQNYTLKQLYGEPMPVKEFADRVASYVHFTGDLIIIFFK